MKCLTLSQPLPSLISYGVVHVLAMDRPTDHRGPIAIHAAREVDWELSHRPEVEHALHAAGVCVIDITQRGNPALGAIVGTATLIDVAPIVDRCRYDTACVWRSSTGLFYCGNKHLGGTWQSRAISDQLPFGDFSPGRWAWILEDAKPTSDRCPECGGDGRGDTTKDITAWCSTCVGEGVCDPVPVKGHAGLWTWEAGR
jgi:hypothetical protein